MACRDECARTHQRLCVARAQLPDVGAQSPCADICAHSHIVPARTATSDMGLLTCMCPCACPAGATQQAVWTCVLLNTLTLAMTCSTYYQLCGNGGVREGLQDSSFLHQAVCAHWLSPIPTTEYPNFSGWMLYGDTADDAVHLKAAAAAARTAAPSPRGSGSSSSIFNVSYWFGSPAPPPPPAEEAFGLGPFNASQIAELVSPVNGPDSTGSVISPVFTMWITLVALYIGAQGLCASTGSGSYKGACACALVRSEF